MIVTDAIRHLRIIFPGRRPGKILGFAGVVRKRHRHTDRPSSRAAPSAPPTLHVPPRPAPSGKSFVHTSSKFTAEDRTEQNYIFACNAQRNDVHVMIRFDYLFPQFSAAVINLL